MTTTQRVIKYCAIALAIFLIAGIIGTIACIIDGTTYIFGGKPSEEMQNMDISGEIKSLDIDIIASRLEIKKGSDFALESNANITAEVKNGVLKITEKRKLFSGYGAGEVILSVPENFAFEEVKIENGAGKFTADNIYTHVLKMDFGAGKADIGYITAIRSAKIDCGAGQFTISGSAMANLDFDMGAGEVNIQSRLMGDCKIDCGVGAMNLRLVGMADDYTLELDKGLGDIFIDGKKTDEGTYGTGADKVEIDGGVGSINISFTNYK